MRCNTSLGVWFLWLFSKVTLPLYAFIVCLRTQILLTHVVFTFIMIITKRITALSNCLRNRNVALLETKKSFLGLLIRNYVIRSLT
jgi:hypothetical protein